MDEPGAPKTNNEELRHKQYCEAVYQALARFGIREVEVIKEQYPIGSEHSVDLKGSGEYEHGGKPYPMKFLYSYDAKSQTEEIQLMIGDKRDWLSVEITFNVVTDETRYGQVGVYVQRVTQDPESVLPNRFTSEFYKQNIGEFIQAVSDARGIPYEHVATCAADDQAKWLDRLGDFYQTNQYEDVSEGDAIKRRKVYQPSA